MLAWRLEQLPHPASYTRRSDLRFTPEDQPKTLGTGKFSCPEVLLTEGHLLDCKGCRPLKWRKTSYGQRIGHVPNEPRAWYTMVVLALKSAEAPGRGR